jgi:biopolymer transport protein ExbB
MEPEATAAATSAFGSMSVIDLIHQGWYATYPLILCSVIMVSLLIERLWTLSRMGTATDALTDEVCGNLRSGNVAAASSAVSAADEKTPASRVYGPVLGLLPKGDLEEILELGERRRLGESRTLKQNVWVIGTIGSSAPFIGLYGTVVGIIKSFHQMAMMGTGGFSVVAAGISEALVATALGLVVAIVAVIFYNYLQVKVSGLDTMLRVGLGRVLESARLGGVHGVR